MKKSYIEDVKELEDYWYKLGWELGCDPSLVNVYHLLRYSSVRQEQGSSINRQMNRQREACLLRGWKEGVGKDRIVQDLGVSAYHAKNFEDTAGLGAFLLRAKQGTLLPHPLLLVENVDRFSRADIDTAESKLWTLVKSGCAVLFLSNGLLLKKGDERDISKKMILLFEFERAHQESKRKSMLSLGAIKFKISKALAGVKVNMACWVPSWLTFSKDPKNPSYSLIPEKAKTVRKMVSLYMKFKAFNPVAVRMNRDKEPQLQKGHTGAGWNARSIKRLLENPMLIGTAKLRDKTFIHFYPPVISMPEWDQVQALLAVPRKTGCGTRPTWKILNLFAGMVTCAYCGKGAKVRHRDVPGKVYSYYMCRQENIGCINTGLRTIAVELDFFGVRQIKSPKEALLASDEVLKGKAGALQAEIAELDAEMKRLSKLVAKKGYEELEVELTATGDRREKAKTELKTLFQTSDAETAERAWKTVKEDIIKMPAINAQSKVSESGAIKKLNEAGFDLQKQLEDQEVRRSLVPMMPSLVKGIVFDGVNDRYAIIGLDGVQGEWLSVELILATMVAPIKEARKQRMKDTIKRYWAGLSAEQRKAHFEPIRKGYEEHLKQSKTKVKSSSAK